MKQFSVSLLFVDDDAVVHSVYKKILRKVTENIYFANNGEEGYRIFMEREPDLVITDIRMPVMNGLEMIRKIKRTHPKVRSIILSSYSESRYFIQAIELGVKGYLIKPTDGAKMIKILQEQIEEIKLEWKVKQEEEKRRVADDARLKSEAILKALVDSSAAFFHYGFRDISVYPALEAIGHATRSSRMYIFENTINDKANFTVLSYEWARDNITPYADDKNFEKISLDDKMFKEWVNRLKLGEYVTGLTKNFKNENLRKTLEERNILSILIIPIFVQEKWWGFIGLDDCFTERVWSKAEIQALEALSNNLGAAIYRKNVELELLQLNTTLEERVRQRTKELEKEIAERKVTEILLRNSEEKYRLIFENANSAILLIRDGIITLVNPEMVNIFDYLPKKMIGLPLSHFAKAAFKDKVINCFERNIFKNNCSSFDIQIITGNNEIKWVEIKSNEIMWDGKNSFLLFISDITARKKAEEGLNKLNKSLEERIREKVEHLKQQQQLLVQKSKLESMGELSAGLAHEINQPLLSLSMGLENILLSFEEGKTPGKQYIQNKMDLLFKDIERINQIIQHVRLFSREQGFTKQEKVSVNEVVRNALSMMQVQMENHNINIEINLSQKELSVSGNQFRLEQVILNLLSNAKYAVEQREKLVHDPGFTKKIGITTLYYKDKNKVHIVVQDNGVGIAKDVLPNIFNPFFTTKKEKEGTGLGLSISYGIIREMGGEIFVESTENELTTFTLELPKADNKVG